MKKRFFGLFTALVLMLSLMVVMPVSALGDLSSIRHNLSRKYYYWDKYEGASKYKVEITSSVLNNTYTVTENQFNYEGIFTKKGIVYYISVTALDSKGKALTYPSKTNHFDRATITGVKVNESTLTVSWDPFYGDFDEYSINISTAAGGTSSLSPKDNSTSASLVEAMKDQPTGDYTLWVDARKQFSGYSSATASSEFVTFHYISTANHITSTDITVPDAVIGEHPRFTAKIVLNGGELAVNDCIESYDVKWVDPSDNYLKSTDVFEEGKTYTLWVTIHLKENNYMDYKTWVNSYENSSINGKKTYMQNLGGLVAYYLETKVTPKAPAEKISTAKLAVTEPVAGETPESAYVIDPVGKVRVRTAWYHGDEKMAEGEKFAAGETYRVTMLVERVKSYEFSIPLSVYLNGTKLNINGQNKYQAFVEQTFTAAGASSRKKGDVVKNDKIDNADLLAVKSHIKKIKTLTGDDLWAADVDGNGAVNNTDLIAMKAHIKGVKKLW